jgi:hypothetical protein
MRIAFPPRLQLGLAGAVVVTGLTVVLIESCCGVTFPGPASIVLRSLFWLTVILYLGLRFSGKFKRPEK